MASLLQPVPEQAWNEDTACASFANQGGVPVCSGGGGGSALFARPKWQTSVPGIPSGGSAGNQRDVPDIALASSIFNPGYLFCTSDQSAWQQNQVGSCSAGFRDAITGDLTAAGGTSFAAPIFAGIMAIVNQRKGYVTGSGLVNPNLYQLASNSDTYASAFHDVTAGDNACDSGSNYCLGMIGFAATPGYDQVTGLGAVDLAHLASVWPTSTAPAILATVITVNLTFSIGDNPALQNLCFAFTDGNSGTGNVTIAGARSVKTQLTFIDMASDLGQWRLCWWPCLPASLSPSRSPAAAATATQRSFRRNRTLHGDDHRPGLQLQPNTCRYNHISTDHRLSD